MSGGDDSSKQPPVAPPCAMVIFGAGGDLTKRLVMPALYNLSCSGLLPKNFALIGVDLVQQEVSAWQKNLHDFLLSTIKKGISGRRRPSTSAIHATTAAPLGTCGLTNVTYRGSRLEARTRAALSGSGMWTQSRPSRWL